MSSEATSGATTPVRTSRMTTFWRELSTFGVLGVINVIIDMGLYNVLVHNGFEKRVVTAKFISGAIATIFAWIGNRYWTFRHRESRPLHHEVLLFFIVNGVALGVTMGWVALAHYCFGAHSWFWLNFNALFGIGLGTIVRFIAYRTVVFGKAAEDPNQHVA